MWEIRVTYIDDNDENALSAQVRIDDNTVEQAVPDIRISALETLIANISMELDKK